jgi:hypothetical protein
VRSLVKAALMTPAYLSVAWVLMVSYQIFTQTAVETVVTNLNLYFPTVGSWLLLRIDMIVFIYAFAWVFVLSSIIPTLILGKERSVIVQFVVCLGITLTALVLVDVLASYGFNLADPNLILNNPYTQMFSNIVFAALYLSVPYVLMIAIDIHGRRKQKEKVEHVKQITDDFFNRKPLTGQPS